MGLHNHSLKIFENNRTLKNSIVYLTEKVMKSQSMTKTFLNFTQPFSMSGHFFTIKNFPQFFLNSQENVSA